MRIGKIKQWTSNQTMTFGKIKLKPMQIAILNCNKVNDVLVNLPTGFGKSLLFQYPASKLLNKCVIVFVPLKALLWDCLKQANEHELSASECDGQFVRKYFRHSTLPQLLFLTPERFFQNNQVKDFIHMLYDQKKIELLVIDEAHCISEWGSDFRPDYSKLSELRGMFPHIRLLGMSATIPPQARLDLVEKLKIYSCYYFQSSSNRTNLIYQVESTEKSKISRKIIDYVKKKNLSNQSGIIYCQTIKNAQQVYNLLLDAKFQCCLFHSKLSEGTRQQNFNDFMQGKVKTIVATICFGMGVNKKNIRYVINVGVSLSAQNYYQESGRAGRDGDISFCLLLTYGSDTSPLTYLINESTKKKNLLNRRIYKLHQIKSYTKCNQCRKKNLFKILGQEFTEEQCKKTCDYCIAGPKKMEDYQDRDFSEKGFQIIEQLSKHRERVTKIQLVGLLKGKDTLKNKITKEKLINLFAFLREQKNQIIQMLVEAMVTEGLLINVSQSIQMGKYKRIVEFLKPCPRSQLKNHKTIIIKVPKINKPNNLEEKFDKYLKNKKKIAQKYPQFDQIQPLPLETKKYQHKSLASKSQVQQSQNDELKQIKMVQMGTDYQKFFEQLFPQNEKNSVENAEFNLNQFSYEKQEDLGISLEQLKQKQSQGLETQLQRPYLEPTSHKKTKEQQTKKQQKEEDSQDQMIYEALKKKKLQLKKQLQQIQEKQKKLVIRKKAQTMQFL